MPDTHNGSVQTGLGLKIDMTSVARQYKPRVVSCTSNFPIFHMDKLSRKHHYIPQFYLEGFCRSDSTFSVYDKEYDHFRDDPQSPGSIFFEKYRNTIRVNGTKTDKIEKLYSNLETQFSELFDLIQSGVHPYKIITEEGIYLLKTFIAIQFWRLPVVDNFANNYAKNFDLKKIGKGITFDGVPIGEIDEISRILKTNKDFQYYFRCFYLPILTFDIFSNNDSLDKWYIFEIDDKSEWAKQICGDNPIVIEDIESFLKFSGTLIFPLTKSRVLIHSPTNEKLSELEPSFSSMLSLLILTQSKKYICGPDKDYISEIIDIYKRTQNKIKLKALYKSVISHIK